MKKAVVFNLGCKVNKYESDILAERLSDGYEVTGELVEADVYVINTCAVTAEAERKSRQAVARCRALNPAAKIFVCGCASERDAASFEKDNVVFVSGSAGKEKILAHLEDGGFKSEIGTLPTDFENSLLTRSDRTRAYVKIQDGCDNFCSYCIIPYLRGRSRSRRIDDVVKEVAALSETTAEIVLTGINMNAYGRDIGTDLPALISALRGLETRVRLSSFYAEGITKWLLDALFSLKNFCPHFHLSLQSGDDGVLKDMNRKYTTDEYAEKISLIRSYDGNAFIAADVITGYPTESEEAHRRTVEFIERTELADLHVFPFSAREGTRASRLKKLPPETVKRRKNELLLLKDALKTRYLERNVGVRQSVLLEESVDGWNTGYSQYYIKVYTKRNGDIVECVPNGLFKDGLKED